MQGKRNFFSLKWTVVLSFVAKFALFLVGLAIVGIASTRTELSACGSSSVAFPVYSTPLGNLEAYTDFRDLYLKCLVNPFLSGSGAYNLPIVYNYPPLFLYTLAAFALDISAWSPAIALVLFDALTVIPVYLIARDCLFSGNSKTAFAIAMIWVFNPINLFYNDLMWLNPGPTTFFLMLGYLLVPEAEVGALFGSSGCLDGLQADRGDSISNSPSYYVEDCRFHKKDNCVHYSLCFFTCRNINTLHIYKPPDIFLGAQSSNSWKSSWSRPFSTRDLCVRSITAYKAYYFSWLGQVREFAIPSGCNVPISELHFCNIVCCPASPPILHKEEVNEQ